MSKRRKKCNVGVGYPQQWNRHVEKPFSIAGRIFFPPSMTSDIVSRVEGTYTDRNGYDDYFRYDVCEWHASLAVIGWILGSQWMMSEMDPIDRQVQGVLQIRSDIDEKAARYALYTDGWCKVMALAKYLEIVMGAKHFSNKIHDMKDTDFDAVLFEIKAASLLMLSGCTLEFVPSGVKGKPIVEFVVDGNAKVECKRKNNGSIDEDSLHNCFLSNITDTSRKLGNDHGSLFILLPTEKEMSREESERAENELTSVFDTLALDEPQLSLKIDSIVVMNEFMREDAELGIKGLATKTVCIKKGDHYDDLPSSFRDAAENPTSVTRRPYWIDYKNLNITKRKVTPMTM